MKKSARAIRRETIARSRRIRSAIFGFLVIGVLGLAG